MNNADSTCHIVSFTADDPLLTQDVFNDESSVSEQCIFFVVDPESMISA